MNDYRTFTKVIYNYRDKTKQQIKEILGLEVTLLERLNEGYRYQYIQKKKEDENGGVHYLITLQQHPT